VVERRVEVLRGQRHSSCERREDNIRTELKVKPTFKGPGGTTRFLLGRRAEL